MSRARTESGPIILALLVVGCTGARPAAPPSAVQAELTDTEDQLPLGMLPAEQEQLIERRADGACLYGVVQAAPLNGDPERVIVLRSELGGAPLDPSLEGRRVLDARFVLDVVVTLDVDHVLRAHGDGNTVDLDATVEGPLSVAGPLVAYGRGEMPFFELARVDVSTSVVETLTHDMAPIWSPALSPDGTEVVFVSSASGHPVLQRLTANGELVPVTTTSRFPTSPRTPRWEGGTLFFEDEAGATSIDLPNGGPLHAPGGGPR